MTSGMAFLGGFIMGAVVIFVVMSWAVWMPRYMELKKRFEDERARRIEAEDSEAFAYGNVRPPTREDWSEPIKMTYIKPKLTPLQRETARAIEEDIFRDVVDLTGIDDVPEAP